MIDVKTIATYDRDVTELSYNYETAVARVQDRDGNIGEHYISYMAAYASRDGKQVYRTEEARRREDLEGIITRWQRVCPEDRVILVYQADNYKYPRQEIESDLALVQIIPDIGKWEKISKGWWSDKNLPQEVNNSGF